MARRSTRQHKAMATTLDSFDLPSEEDVAFTPQAEDGDETPVETKSRGRKRKQIQGKVSGQPSTKKLRGKRGSLQELLEMPLDVLFEICGHLEPLDLLNLARTSKDIRALFMKRSSVSMWKAARSNIPGFPDCPDDLSEPKYAHLAFVKMCHLCFRNLGTIHIFWAARVRACTKCLENSDEFMKNYGPSTVNPPELSKLRKLIPSMMVIRSGHKMDEYYYLVADSIWKEGYKKAEDKSKWVEDEIKKQLAIDEHSKACKFWANSLQVQLQQAKASLVDQRKVTIVERLRTQGWGEELDRMPAYPTERNITSQSVVVKACQKDLTTRVLLALDPELDVCMRRLKEERIERERQTILEGRLPILHEVVKTFLSTLPLDAVFLDIGDIFTHPIVSDLIYNSPPGDLSVIQLDSLRSILPDVVADLRSEIDDKLLALIASACGPTHVFDKDYVFSLATTMFSCSGCSYVFKCGEVVSLIRYPRVIVHSCATRYSYFEEKDPSHRTLHRVTRHTAWNRCGRIRFKAETHKILSDVVTLCGFDPKTTTAKEMDLADPIVECVSCNHAHRGRVTMRWSVVPIHKERDHNLFGSETPMKLALLNDRDAMIARGRMNENEALKRADVNYRGMVCVHCKETGCSVTLWKHVKKEHGISNPTDRDIALALDANYVQNTFYLWPAREEEGTEVEVPATKP